MPRFAEHFPAPHPSRAVPTRRSDRQGPARSGNRRAFTLIEVTISVALALVLMLGVSEVFRVVGETVGTGQALAVAQRDSRAVQAVMASDFNSAVSDTAPFMLLYSQQVFAFRNQQDLLGDKDGDPSTFDPLATGTESGQPPAVYNYRSHRIDALTFFGRGSFNRQTGADVTSGGSSPFVANMGGLEAMLWYGHLNLADNNGTFTTTGTTINQTPGAGTGLSSSATYYNTGGDNPNNYFATSWILGRQQILLQGTGTLDNNNATIGAQIIDNTYPNGKKQYAYMPSAATPLSPLSYNSEAFDSSNGTSPLNGAGGGTFTLLSSRIDLAGTTILGYRSGLASYVASAANPPWWPLLPTGTNSLRFQAQPFFIGTSASAKITPETIASQAPIFVRGCTQFTVEYAGDYLNQTTSNAAVTAGNQGITDTYYHTDGSAGSTDGQIDYIITGTYPNFVQKIRWYGLPRSTTNTPGTAPSPVSISAANGDVAPLRDTLTIAATSVPTLNPSVAAAVIPTVAPFEKMYPAASADYANATSGMPAGAQYICAWGPNDPKPKMIRITMTIDDPGGRLGDGQTYEYIYTLP
jgi:hypothetical protein